MAFDSFEKSRNYFTCIRMCKKIDEIRFFFQKARLHWNPQKKFTKYGSFSECTRGLVMPDCSSRKGMFFFFFYTRFTDGRIFWTGFYCYTALLLLGESARWIGILRHFWGSNEMLSAQTDCVQYERIIRGVALVFWLNGMDDSTMNCLHRNSKAHAGRSLSFLNWGHQFVVLGPPICRG